MNSTVWIVVGSVASTALVILLAMIAVSVISTLTELRLTAQRVRELVERLGPELEQTVADVRLTAGNAREVSTVVARGAQSVEKLASGLGQLKLPSLTFGRTGTWAMLAAVATALFAVLRRRRARGTSRRR